MLHITPMSRRRWRIAAIACALPAAMLLAGCGKKQAEPAVVGQVIAHVGPDDVTQQELDNELRLANVPADKRSDPILKAALSRVVERKYLVQQAIAAKLDREPTVHLDILRSREQILAGAFVQRDLSSKMSADFQKRDRQLHPRAIPSSSTSGSCSRSTRFPSRRRRTSRPSRRRRRISSRLIRLKRS